jgi:hypothetical protein
MDDGNELTVSLKDYPHPERRLCFRPSPYIGQTIRFTGMGAVKEGGFVMPITIKGNIRDEKVALYKF